MVANAPAADVFEILADPTRRQLLRLIADAEAGVRPRWVSPSPEGVSVGELVDRVEISQPAVSKQLRVLREAGLVGVTPRGRRRLYRVMHGELRRVSDWVAYFDRLWDERLDRLGDHLDRQAEKESQP